MEKHNHLGNTALDHPNVTMLNAMTESDKGLGVAKESHVNSPLLIVGRNGGVNCLRRLTYCPSEHSPL